MNTSTRHFVRRAAKPLFTMVVLTALSVPFLECDRATNPFYVPAEITYPDSLIGHVGTAVDTIVPELAKNVEVDSYTVTPELPRGLLVDPDSGTITGTPQGPPGVETYIFNAHNQWGVSDDAVLVIMICPPPPRNIAAASDSGSGVSLTWEPVDSVDGYGVYRASERDGQYERIGQTAHAAYEDTAQLVAGQEYFYYVVAEHDETYPSLAGDTAAATVPLVIVIISPAGDTMMGDTAVTLRYTVNGDTLSRTERLVEGENEVVVDSTSPLGATGADTVHITVDTTPPGAPVIQGASLTNDRTPTWSWSSDSTGSGIFRYSLDSDDFDASSPETTLTSFTPETDLNEGTHTLYVWERDAVGNWSLPGSKAILIDTSAAGTPQVSGVSPTNETQPTWIWSSGGGVGIYRLRLDDPDLTGISDTTSDTTFTPSSALTEGAHTLYVQERDSAGNWSASGVFVVTVDLTPPVAPTVTGPAQTAELRPTWSWSPGGEGNGTYRYRLDSDDLSVDATVTTDTSYTPDSDLSEDTHSLYVQERDAAGNWSVSGSHAIDISSTAPEVSVTAPALTNDSLVVEDASLNVSGTVQSAAGVASVEATLNGSPVAVSLSGKQWFLALTTLRGTQWNEIVVTAEDMNGKLGRHSFWVYGRFGLPTLGAPEAEGLCSSCELTWNRSDIYTDYIVWRRRVGDAESQFMVVADGVSDTSYRDSDLSGETAVEYRLQAFYTRQTGSYQLADTSELTMIVSCTTISCFRKALAVTLEDACPTDNGFIAASTEARLVEYDRLGNEVEFRYCGTGFEDLGYAVAEAVDGSYFLSGTSCYGTCPGCAFMWQVRGIDGRLHTREFCTGMTARDIVILSNGGYVLVGQSEARDGIWVTRQALPESDTIWTQVVAPGNSNDIGYSITEMPDGSILAAGGYSGMSFVNIAGDGTMLWRKSIETPGCDGHAYCNSMTQLPGGDIIAVGVTCEGGGSAGAQDGWIIRMTAAGDTLWSRTLGSGGVDEILHDVAPTEGGVLIVGEKGDQAWMAQVSENGETVWSKTGSFGYKAIAAIPGGGYIMAGGPHLDKTDRLGSNLGQ